MNKEAGKWQANLVAGEKSKRGGRMILELGEALKVGVFMQCCGFDLGKGWFCFELCSPDGDDPDRCPKPATFTYDNGTERIPLCAEHYDAWRADEAEPGETVPAQSGFRKNGGEVRGLLGVTQVGYTMRTSGKNDV
jgi:hypothetical protein